MAMSLPSLDQFELARVHGGAKKQSKQQAQPTLDPQVPAEQEQHLIQQCGPQIDAYTAARKAYDADKTDTRKEIAQTTAGRALALCSTNAGYEPPASWRSK